MTNERVEVVTGKQMFTWKNMSEAQVRPSHVENLHNPNVRYENMTPEQEKWTHDALFVIGLPTRNISFVRYEENTTENPNWLGSVNYADGSMRLWSHLASEGVRSNESMQTVYHEGIHEASAFNDKNDALYGSKENREAVKNFIREVADQSVITGIPLNGYHAELMRALGKKEEDGGISSGRFYRETEAILGQMRVFDNEGLIKIQEQQRENLEIAQLLNPSLRKVEFVQLAGGKDSESLVGVEKGLAILHRVDGKQSLEEKIKEINSFTNERPSPFSNQTKTQGGSDTYISSVMDIPSYSNF